MIKQNIIGLMSGTSLDGLDIVYAEFTFRDNQELISFKIINSESYPYENKFIHELKRSTELNIVDFLRLDKKIGSVFGNFIND